MQNLKVEFTVSERDAVWLIGKETTVEQGKTAENFVTEFRTDGSNAVLQAHTGKITPDGDIIIWMGEYDSIKKSFKEVVGVFVEPKSKVGEGFCVREIPKCIIGICTIKGKTRNITRGAHNKLIKAAANVGYVPDYSYGFSLEYYSYEEYEKDGDEYTFRYMLPCKKANK